MTDLLLPTDPSFGHVPLPDWIQEGARWSRQLDIAHEVVDCFKSGAPIVFIQAPTGTGKTLIAELVRRLLMTDGIYSCTTKALQDQMARDFPYAKVLKGKVNYLTDSGVLDSFGNVKVGRWSDITCADCTFTPTSGECRFCMTRSLCPYQLAKNKAKTAELAVLNMSYLLTDLNKGQGNFAGRGLVTLDECDELEWALLDHTELDISKAKMERMGLEPPKRKTVENSWYGWVKTHAVPTVNTYMRWLTKPDDPGATADDIKEFKATRVLLEQLLMLQRELPQPRGAEGGTYNTGSWVYDGYKGDVVNNIIFRPVYVSKFGKSMLWPHGERFLLMSATILSPDMMASELGITTGATDDLRWELVDVPSTFPIANRPIYIVPLADMSFKNKNNTTGWERMARGVRGVCGRHEDERILVHTVSYELARYLRDSLSDLARPVITYHSSDGKRQALADYSRLPNSVLIASSMDRGVDLPGDLCRVQVIAKIPFLNTTDKRVEQRLWTSGGKSWYRMNAIRTIVQMCGRGVRSETDHAKTYILDSQFVDNLWKSSFLFPQYWADAIDWPMSSRIRGQLM